MAQYFTVKMVAKKIIVSFDAKGRKTGERTELIPQTYTDLPHSTALAYKTKFPDAQVQIIAQAAEFGGKSFNIGTSAKSQHTGRHFKPSDQRQVEEKVASEDYRAAQTGDMSAAINAELGS